MKKIKPTIEQVREIYEAVPSMREMLEEEYSKRELFGDQYFVGKWVKLDDNLFFVQMLTNEGRMAGYGLDNSGRWVGEKVWGYINGFVKLVTDKEVEDTLLKYARDNYSPRCKIKDLKGIEFCFEGGILSTPFEAFSLYTNRGGVCRYIYSNGKWAEIVEEAPERIFVPKEIGIVRSADGLLLMGGKHQLLSVVQVIGDSYTYGVNAFVGEGINTGENFELIRCNREDIKPKDLFFSANTNAPFFKDLFQYRIAKSNSAAEYVKWTNNGVREFDVEWSYYYKVKEME